MANLLTGWPAELWFRFRISPHSDQNSIYTLG